MTSVACRDGIPTNKRKASVVEKRNLDIRSAMTSFFTSSSSYSLSLQKGRALHRKRPAQLPSKLSHFFDAKIARSGLLSLCDPGMMRQNQMEVEYACPRRLKITRGLKRRSFFWRGTTLAS